VWFEELGRRAANWLTLRPTPKTPTTVWVGRRTHAPLKHLKHTHNFSWMERIVDYAAAAPGAGRIDVMTARGEHDLLWQTEGRRKVWSEWVATLPMEMSGALAATPWPVLGEVVLPHLRLAEELRTQVPVEVVYTAEAWDLWLHALEELQGSEMPAACWWQQWCLARCRCGAEPHTDMAATCCELVGCQRRRRGALQLDLRPRSCMLRSPLRLHGSSSRQLPQLAIS
jgi:hypothetical protein